MLSSLTGAPCHDAVPAAPAPLIAGIVLAAGLSRRMGQPKLLLPLAGRAVVRHATERLLTAGLDPVIVVVGAEREAIESALDGLPVRIAVNPRPEAGQAGSVRSGIESVPPEVEGALVALGDQPFVAPHVIARLLDALRASGKSIAAPRYRDGLG